MRPLAEPRRTILAVDDDEHTRNLLRDLCEAAGFEVRVAQDGVEALEAIAHGAPNLVLLDLMLPQKDGFSVLKELRENPATAHLPVVILTAIGDLDGKIRGMELGADDYVTKPFKLIELQTRINSALMVREYKEKLAAAEDQLVQLRAVDPVTGAGTYAQLKASLDGELARSKRYGRPASVLLVAVDDYQGLRYQLGRERCDVLMAMLAGQVRDNLRGADRLFRVEVDQFVMLLPETDRRGARITAERMAGLLERLGSEGVSVRLRFAGAAYPDERIQSSEDLLREANRVYRAMQAAGPDRLIFEL
jgi:diguanylate cyclase